MNINQTAMMLMLLDLRCKQIVYEQSGMRESIISLETSIELAKNLLKIEKEQIKDAFNAGRTWNNSWNAEEYFKNLSISNQLNDFLNGK